MLQSDAFLQHAPCRMPQLHDDACPLIDHAQLSRLKQIRRYYSSCKLHRSLLLSDLVLVALSGARSTSLCSFGKAHLSQGSRSSACHRPLSQRSPHTGLSRSRPG